MDGGCSVGMHSVTPSVLVSLHADCTGLPTDPDFAISNTAPASMASCISLLKGKHPNWQFRFFQNKDASKMDLDTFAAKQYAQARKVTNHCDLQEENREVALQFATGCQKPSVSVVSASDDHAPSVSRLQQRVFST